MHSTNRTFTLPGARLLIAAALASCALAAPGATAASGAAAPGDEALIYVPGEVVVGREDGSADVVEIDDATSVAEAVAELERDPGVRFAAPNWVAHTALAPLDVGTSGQVGGWRSDQWSFLGRPGGIRVGGAWDRAIAAGSAGGAGVTVAVVDTGLTYAPGNGYAAAPDFDPTRFAPGIDLVDDDAVPFDENGHGTHVAATIGESVTVGEPAVENDYLTGIAYGATLMPVRVLDRSGAGAVTDVADGVLWAAKNGADIINLSLQFDATVTGCAQVPTLCTAVRKAGRRGSLVIAAAGNALTGAGSRKPLYPAGAPKAFAVAATTEHGCLASYSQFGKGTDLLAPGGGTPRPAAAREECTLDQRPILQLSYECFPGRCAGVSSEYAVRPDLGTSMAAAHTSGVAALVLASGAAGAHPTPKRLALRLACTARSGKPTRFYRQGLLDAGRATSPAIHCDQPR